MKKLIAVALLAAVVVGVAVTPPPAGNISMAWYYPQAELSTNLSFQVHWSPVVTAPLASWGVVTNVSGLKTNVTVKMAPGANFFYVTASNMWGVSDPSNVASTPPLPRDNVVVSITGVD